jgi:NAD(P)-dependent dehydrogenase (short-subunit alcohol dehydrogenase family)
LNASPDPTLASFPPGGLALVVGSGAIATALTHHLQTTQTFAQTIQLGRPALDLTDESTIAHAATLAPTLDLRLVIVATGFLHNATHTPEKTWRDLTPAHMAHSFAINATGPALLLKHLAPRLPRTGKSTFAALSARVGSIADNRLGGWYSYRAAKAALNQILHTASIELARTRPHATIVALHPGTVASPLSAPFAKSGLILQTPAQSAARLLAVIDSLDASASGSFHDYRGEPIPW